MRDGSMWGVGLVLFVAACGGRVNGASEGTAAPTETSDACETNPYGTCYPARVGTTPMTGAARGDRIPNFKFVGFRAEGVDAVVDTTTTTEFSLADYYDPERLLGPAGKGFTIIHVLVETAWCGPSNEYTDFIAGANYTGANTGGASWAKELAPLGVVFVELLVDGKVVGEPATVADLRDWVTHHQINYTVGLDSFYLSLGSLTTAAAIPFTMDIDARSMEILDAEVGFDTNGDTAIKHWIEWQTLNSPL